MSTEIESGLPVRSYQDTVDERVLTKIQDGDSPGAAGSTTQVSEKKLHVRNHSKDSDGTDREQLLSQEGHSLTNGDYDGTLNKRPSSQGQILHDRKFHPYACGRVCVRSYRVHPLHRSASSGVGGRGGYGGMGILVPGRIPR